MQNACVCPGQNMLYLDICTGTQTHSLSGGQIWQKRRGARNLLPLTLLWRSPGLLTTELLQLTPKDDPKDRGAPSHPQTPPSGLQGSISCPSGTRSPMRVSEQGVSPLKWRCPYFICEALIWYVWKLPSRPSELTRPHPSLHKNLPYLSGYGYAKV